MIKIAALIVSLSASSSAVFAQSGQAVNNAILRVTVVDPSSAIVVGATVTVIGAEEATKAVAVPPSTTTENGVAILPGLKPGRYGIRAEFPGFEPRVLSDVRVRSGENKQVAVLSLPKLEAAVTVGRDRQESAADRNSDTFGTTLTRDQIEALSDDPATLQQQLQDMAGPGAVIHIDGFEGGGLPAKAQIRSIRISRDQFAAEFHSAGGVSIEIITQPGLGPVRYYSNFGFRNPSFSGRSPFVPVRGPEQNLNYGFGAGGALIREKSSFNLNVFGTSSYDTPNLNAATPTGTLQRALDIKAPRDNLFVNGQVDYALTLDQTLRFGYNLRRFVNTNLGVGGYDEPERAYSTENAVHTARVQHFGPLGRRAFTRSRIQLIWSDTATTSSTEAPTIRVLDAFTSGGAQLSGGDHARTVNIGSDLDYVVGRHSLRSGILVDATWYHSNAASDYLGTFTFNNLDAYLANRPSNYSRRVGDPRVEYGLVQAGMYVQDDIRVRKNLTMTPGLRYELQSHVSDRANVGPRFGVTWAPFKSGMTTLRASTGVFYDWLGTTTLEQSLRVDGLHQQELNIVDPSYPDPGAAGVVPPINKYILGDDYHAPRMTRVGGGIEQQLMRVTRVSATYHYQFGSRQSRGLNLNAPVGGVRPTPGFANIVDVISDAASRQQQMQVDATVNPGAMLPAFNGPLISWKRTTLFANYTLTKLRNNTNGPFSLPATGTLAAEWGPAMNDIRHRLNLAFNNQIVRNLMIGLNMSGNTAPAYTLLTGRDDNGDGVFNDRPLGVGRNTLRASARAELNLFLAYQFAFGNMAPLPPGIGVFGGGGSMQVRSVDQGTKRVRLQIFVQAQNLTNQANYLGYSGVMTSPFFAKPTTVGNMRKIDGGIGINF